MGDMPAPMHAADAAAQVDALSSTLDDRRRTALRLRGVRDDAETLYRREQSKARLVVEGRNADDRAANVELSPLSDAVIVEGHGLACRLFGDESDWKPESVGDLRWLRDRAEGMADATSASAYDARERLKSWSSVAAMARSEAELAPPERGPRAVPA